MSASTTNKILAAKNKISGHLTKILEEYMSVLKNDILFFEYYGPLYERVKL